MYYAYGERGIKVCDRWSGEKGFINFYKDMGNTPREIDGRFYQIDRINPNENYSPENCRWVKAIDNARNKRNSIKIYFMGEEYCINELCKKFGLKRTSITEPIRLGRRSIEDSFTKVFTEKYGGELCAH